MFNAFAQFHFLRPEWFFAIIPVVLILTWLRFEKKSQGDWQNIIPKHLLKHLLHEKQGSSSNAALSLLSLLWLLSIVALAGPTWQKVPQPVYEKIQARVYVLDLSYSMYAADLKPNRIVRARLKLIDLLNSKREGLSALVVFSGDAHVVTPLTNDVNTIVSLIPALEPKIMPNIGSNAKEGVKKALELLSNTKVEKGEIILITDEVLLNDRQNINALLENSAYKLSILGVGTPEGAPINLPNGQFLKDKSGAIVIPKLNEAELKNLAEDNKGRYVKLRQDDKDVRYLHKENKLEASNDSRESQQNFDLWLEFGQWLMFPILLFAAFSFRKGWLLALLLCLNFMPLSEKVYADTQKAPQNSAQNSTQSPIQLLPQAPAQIQSPANIGASKQQNKNPQTKESAEEKPSTLEKLSENWQALWRTGDQRGIASMKAQNFSAAAKQFNNKDWKASAHYYNGQFAQAAELFSPDETSNKNQQSDTWYNRANALARSGDLNGAIKAYDKSLALNPDNEDASFNKKLVEDLKNKQPPQQQQKNDKQDKQEQKNGDQNQEQQSNGKKNDQQKGEQSDQQNSDQKNADKNDSTDNKNEQNNPDNSDSDKNDSEKNESDKSDSEQQDDQKKDGDKSDQQTKEQAEQQAEEDKKSKDKAEAEEQQAQQSDADKENSDKASEEALSPLDREKQQALEQWLRQVPDDPSGLMRRKFELENMRSKQNSRSSSNDNQQVW